MNKKDELINYLNNLDENKLNAAIEMLRCACGQWGFEYEERQPHADICEDIYQLLK